ncbi:hypothetical protein MCERE19_02265 [Spirosomataceae bacterium]
MSNLEIVLKWVMNLRGSELRPKAYYFRDGRPTKQLTLAEMRFHVSTGNIVDKKVVEWVKARAAETEIPELEVLEEKAEPETFETEIPELEVLEEKAEPETFETEMPELEVLEEKAKPETLKDKEGFAPNSRELYEYLESLYSKSVRPLGSGSYRDLVDKSSNSKRIADY